MTSQEYYQCQITELALHSAAQADVDPDAYREAAAAFEATDEQTVAAAVLVRYLCEKLDEVLGLEPGQYLRGLDLSIRISLAPTDDEPT